MFATTSLPKVFEHRTKHRTGVHPRNYYMPGKDANTFVHFCCYLKAFQHNALTLAKLAVNNTHSNNSPIRFRNSSTWGRFSTYTWDQSGNRACMSSDCCAELTVTEILKSSIKTFGQKSITYSNNKSTECKTITTHKRVTLYYHQLMTSCKLVRFLKLVVFFLNQVIPNRLSRHHKPILDYLNQAKAGKCHPDWVWIFPLKGCLGVTLSDSGSTGMSLETVPV